MTDQSRRNFLGAAAGMSAVAIGFQAFADEGTAYTESTTITTATDIDIHVDWRSEYNGTIVESRDPGPGIPLHVSGAMTGDSGRVVFRIRAETSDGSPVAITASFDDGNPDTPDVLVNAENGRNQPELEAGDTTETEGELLDAIDARAWYDVGVLGASFLGGCDGSIDATETLVSGSLRDVTDALQAGIPIPETGCIGPEEGACFGIEWSLDTSVGNQIQGDSVDFPFGLTAEVCDSR